MSKYEWHDHESILLTMHKTVWNISSHSDLVIAYQVHMQPFTNVAWSSRFVTVEENALAVFSLIPSGIRQCMTYKFPVFLMLMPQTTG